MKNLFFLFLLIVGLTAHAEKEYQKKFIRNAEASGDKKLAEGLRYLYSRPDQIAKTAEDKALAACVKSDSTAGQCLLDLAKKNPTSKMFDSLLRGLENGWIKKPWGVEVLNGVHPLLNSEKHEIRGFYSKWHELDKERKGEKNLALLDTNDSLKSIYKIRKDAYVPGLVQVGSTYTNENSSGQFRSVEEVGTGNLVLIPGQSESSSYILTAAHLVGGKNPKVFIKDRSFAVKGFVTNNDLDIALIETELIDGPQAMTFDQQNNRLITNSEIEQAYYRQTIPTAILFFSSMREAMDGIWGGLIGTLVMNPWSEEGIEYHESAFRTEDNSFSSGGLSYDLRHYRARIKVTGGISGSFFFRQKGLPIVEGLVTQSNYYFSETFFIRSPDLTKTVKSYLSGRRGNLSSTIWKMKNGLAYRQYAGGWSEANFSDRKVGKGIMGDAGKGVVGDPGKGVVGDPGKGVVGDPGKNRKFSPWSAKSPQQLFDFYGLEPGMKLNGKSIIGIYASALSPSAMPAKMFLYADDQALEFMKKYANHYEFFPVENGSDLLTFTHRRLGFAYDQTIYTIPTGGAPTDLEKERFDHGRAGGGFSTRSQSLEIRQDEIRLRMKTYSEKYADLSKKSVEDELEIILNAQCIPKGSNQKQFLPIIETKGLRSGQKYYVDLRRLIFQDLSQINLPTWTNDQNIWKAEIKRQLETFAVKARNANSGLEVGFTFVPQP